MLMEYSIGKQRSPFGFQSHPKYSLNKHSFPKNVITAIFGSMSVCLIQINASVTLINQNHKNSCFKDSLFV